MTSPVWWCPVCEAYGRTPSWHDPNCPGTPIDLVARVTELEEELELTIAERDRLWDDVTALVAEPLTFPTRALREQAADSKPATGGSTPPARARTKP